MIGPRITPRKPSDQFERYAVRYKRAASVYASALSSTRDPTLRQHYEAKFQHARDQAAFYEEKAREARDKPVEKPE